MYVHPDDDTMCQLLEQSRNIAVVGLSDKPQRDSYRVSLYMQQQGYKIIPVNPRARTVLGEKSYPDLSSIPEPVDIVNVFRRSELVPAVVREALTLAPRAIWLQLGIVNHEAAAMAEKAGVAMIMDKCIMVEHRRFFGMQPI